MEKFKHAQSRKDRIANPHVPTSQLLGVFTKTPKESRIPDMLCR